LSGPFFKETVNWALEDLKGKSIEKVREIRDEIEQSQTIDFRGKLKTRRIFSAQWQKDLC
jgi:hypothetical protein